MRVSKAITLAAGVVAALTSASALAANINISEPMARAVPAVSTNSAAFMTIDNNGAKNITLVAAESDVAKRVELHGHKTEGDLMRMFRVEGGIEIPGKGQVKLQSGGFHIMMMGLTRPMKAGDHIDVTLYFSDGDSKKVTMPVMDMRKNKKDMAHGGMVH